MIVTRNHLLPCLGLILISCDKSAEKLGTSAKESLPPRITKSIRAPREDELPASPAQLRDTIKKAEEIISPKERDQALCEAVRECLDTDPKLARDSFQKLTIGCAERNQLIQEIASHQADQGVKQAIEWIETLDDDHEKSLAYDSIALIVAENEPEKAAQMLSDSGVAGHDFDVAVVQVVQRWASSAPQNAAEWVMLFNNDEVRKAGLKAIASTWSRNNPQEAMNWLADIANPTIHQEASAGMVEAIMNLPESKREAVLKLTTPDIRDRFEKFKSVSNGG
jgi:hypothetical protein